MQDPEIVDTEIITNHVANIRINYEDIDILDISFEVDVITDCKTGKCRFRACYMSYLEDDCQEIEPATLFKSLEEAKAACENKAKDILMYLHDRLET